MSKSMPPRPALLARWQALLGRPPPARYSTVRLYRDIRYAEQITADPELQRLERRVNERLQQLARQPKPKKAKKQSILPGTRLLREWRGATYQVLVTESGYLYRGDRYRSLTAIATEITGTRWSGPKFFGLK